MFASAAAGSIAVARSRISWAALLVKVTASIAHGGMLRRSAR